MIAKFFQRAIGLFYLTRIAWVSFVGCTKVILTLWISNCPSPRLMINNELRNRSAKIMKMSGSKIHLLVDERCSMKQKEPYIYISNHTSLLDPPLIYSLIPGTIRFISKQALFDIPLFGQALKKAEMISIEKNDFFEHLKQLMKNGVSIWMFPEGQRSKDGTLLNFKAGAFSLARQIGAKIVPAAIMGTHQVLAAKTLRLGRGFNTEIRIGQPIDSLHYSKPEQQSAFMRDAWNSVNNLMKS
jgi:1-acyl-sn-glycerol-3-phosphate acyltransferase